LKLFVKKHEKLSNERARRHGLTARFVSTQQGASRDSMEIHVAKDGDDAAAGSASAPLLTINRAAALALPGDVVVVHEGTYREWVKPPHGGLDANRRIVFRAADGERVVIK